MSASLSEVHHLDPSPRVFSSASRHTRFEMHESDDGEITIFCLYDTSRPQPLNNPPFFCVSTFDRKIDALIACVELNDGEDGVL